MERIRKLMLTGMLVLTFPETPGQIVVGLLMAFASSVIYAHFKPFRESEDDFLSEVAQCQVFFVLLTALLAFISQPSYVGQDADAGSMYSGTVFGWLLVLVGLVGPLIGLALFFREQIHSLIDQIRALMTLITRGSENEEAKAVGVEKSDTTLPPEAEDEPAPAHATQGDEQRVPDSPIGLQLMLTHEDARHAELNRQLQTAEDEDRSSDIEGLFCEPGKVTSLFLCA